MCLCVCVCVCVCVCSCLRTNPRPVSTANRTCCHTGGCLRVATRPRTQPAPAGRRGRVHPGSARRETCRSAGRQAPVGVRDCAASATTVFAAPRGTSGNSGERHRRARVLTAALSVVLARTPAAAPPQSQAGAPAAPDRRGRPADPPSRGRSAEAAPVPTGPGTPATGVVVAVAPRQGPHQQRRHNDAPVARFGEIAVDGTEPRALVRYDFAAVKDTKLRCVRVRLRC